VDAFSLASLSSLDDRQRQVLAANILLTTCPEGQACIHQSQGLRLALAQASA